MGAPEYVPHGKAEKARVYESPPRDPESWHADRPGELVGSQPSGPRLGYQGPDQGYVLKLARSFEGKLALGEGEHEADAIAGCTGVALKRASLFGRAPMIHDLTLAFTVWGFLEGPDADQVAMRKPVFAEVASPHRFMEARRVADLVPVAVLKMSPEAVTAQRAREGWKSFFMRKTAPAS